MTAHDLNLHAHDLDKIILAIKDENIRHGTRITELNMALAGVKCKLGDLIDERDNVTMDSAN